MSVFFLGLLPILLVVVAAPIGATVCGAVAISQIRRSSGRVEGLGLALADTLLFPLLALNALIGYCLLLLPRILAGSYNHRSVAIVAIAPAIPICAIVDFLLVRWAWRAANRTPAPNAGVSAVAPHGMAHARQVVWAPAMGLLLATGINLAMFIALLALVLIRTRGRGLVIHTFIAILPSLAILAGAVINAIVLFGAINMMAVRKRGWAIAAAILALIAAPGNLIGLPMGIWALVVLSRREVAEAFAASPAEEPLVKPRTVRRAVAIGVLVLIALVVWNAWPSSPTPWKVPVSAPPSDPYEAKVWHAIRLVGVSPDGGDDLLDPNGKLIGKSWGVGPWNWRADAQARALVFDIPPSPQLQWPTVFPGVYVSETGRPLGGDLRPWTADIRGKRRRILSLAIDRTYSQTGWFTTRKVPIDRIDVVLKYYLPGRGKAQFTFIGPFETDKTVRAREGQGCVLKFTGSPLQNSRRTAFHLSANVDVYDRQVLAYDASGKRHFVGRLSGRRTGSGNRVSVEQDYYIHDVPLSRIAFITIGEQPQQKTFRNIRVGYPDRPIRTHPEYQDKMASALGLGGLSPKQLYERDLKSADEALKVIDVVRGRHIQQAWQAMQTSKVDLAGLPQNVREKLRRAAKTWADNGNACGIEVGLEGQWPEFVAPALALLGRDDGSRSVVANSLYLYHRRARLTPRQLGRIAAILAQRDDPRGMLDLLRCLRDGLRRPGGQEAMLRLARSDKAWLWWPAMEYLTGSRGLTLGQLPRGLQVKYLAKTKPELGLDPALTAEAQGLLAKLPTAKLAAMSIGTLSEVIRSVTKNLPRADAEAALLDLLQDMVAHWGDYRVEGYSPPTWWAIDRSVRYLNQWNNLNLGGVGTDVNQETERPSAINWPAMAKKVLVHFGRIPAPATKAPVRTGTRSRERTLVDALGQPIPDATLDLWAAPRRHADIYPRAFQVGPRIRRRTDSKGRFRIDWSDRVAGRKIFDFTGRASHPDYGIAPITVSSGRLAMVLLVKKGSPQYQRALKGQVLNEAGQPVAGAVVQSNGALAPRMNGRGNAITDPNGRFVMHLLPYSEDSRKPPLPADAKYRVTARAPAGTDLFPVRAEGRSPMRLVLRTPTLRPRRLRFEVGEDEYAPTEDLWCVGLTWASSGRSGRIRLEERYLSGQPVGLLSGRYYAEYHDTHRRSFQYPPIQIDGNSPDVITFRRQPLVTYHGQVADGTTGKPMAGVFVFLYAGGRGSTSLAMLFERDWRHLQATPNRPSPDDPGVKTLSRHYEIKAIVRTDALGRYELTRGREQNATSLIVFSKDRLPMTIGLPKPRANGPQRVQVPPIAMFPAAYVKLYPKVPVGLRASAYPQWEYQAKGQPEWFPRFREATKRTRISSGLDLSGPVRIFAPAGVKLKLRLRTHSNSSCVPEPHQWVLDLSPGETKDLGEVKFLPVPKPAVAPRREPPGSRPATP